MLEIRTRTSAVVDVSLQSSVFMRDWALNRWSENEQVDLVNELPRLKAEIKVQREIEEQALQEQYGDELDQNPDGLLVASKTQH